MTEKASFTLTDSAATPESPGTPAAVNRTFTPGEVENGYVHTYYNTTTGTTASTRSKLTMSISTNDKIARVKLAIATPKAQTVDGVVQAAHVTRGFAEFIIPVDASRDDRKDILILVYNALASAPMAGLVHELEDLW